MASSSLSSASNYLNNLLLARGLLQNGKAIDFAYPDQDDLTMSRVINIVHDLILRRDKDAEQREVLANNLRTMRADEAQRVLDMQRVQDKNAELTRNMSMVEAQDRSLRASVRKAEATAKDFKEQTLKMKSTLDQVRAKCLSDVRKRDLEIEKLKGHLSGMRRGKRDANGGMKINPSISGTGGRDTRSQNLNGAEWSLEKEGNDVLASLVNETSSENVALRSIVTEALETLQEMTGLKEDVQEERIDEKDGIGIPGQYRKSRQQGLVAEQEIKTVSCERLARNMSAVLEHTKSILKDPSFVPIEEVHIREEEIVKLRDGWEKMAVRWKEAVTMMDTWRRRMLEGGAGTVDVGQLSDLGFGRSVAVLPNGQPVLGEDEGDLSSALFDNSKIGLPQLDEEDEHESSEPDPHPFDNNKEDEGFSFDIPEPSPKRLAVSPRRGLKLPRPVAAPLAETNANTRTRAPATDLLKKHPVSRRSSDASNGNSEPIYDHNNDDENDTFAGRNLGRSIIPKHNTTNRTALSLFPTPLSVSEKLAAIEAEARKAEARRERRQNQQQQQQQQEVEEEVDEEEIEERSEPDQAGEEVEVEVEVEAVVVPRKRKPSTTNTSSRTRARANGLRRSRRRSTLSPEELATLMGVR